MAQFSGKLTDVDTIVLDNISFVFECLSDYDCLNSHSNMPQLRQHVWKESIYESSSLSDDQISFSANTGFIASRKGFLTISSVFSQKEKALQIKEHMVLFCQEQSFLNYLIVTSGKRYSSIHTLAFEQAYENLRFECWAGIKGGIISNGKLYFKDRPPIFLIHWAGLWKPTHSDKRLYDFLVRLGMKFLVREPAINSNLPYKKLWKYYRKLNPPAKGNGIFQSIQKKM